jgi:succinylarginine dihydrolase
VHWGEDLFTIGVGEDELTPAEAVETYLFNSQIVTLPGGEMVLVAPMECQENPRTRVIIDRILADKDTPIRSVHYVNIRQSMRNGGGPACLRLRVVLSEKEMGALHPGVLLTDRLYQKLREWIFGHYRDRLDPQDLADPSLLNETRSALDDLTCLLDLGGGLYDFQR